MPTSHRMVWVFFTGPRAVLTWTLHWTGGALFGAAVAFRQRHSKTSVTDSCKSCAVINGCTSTTVPHINHPFAVAASRKVSTSSVRRHDSRNYQHQRGGSLYHSSAPCCSRDSKTFKSRLLSMALSHCQQTEGADSCVY